jgi:H+-transporting ATPase
MAAQDSADADLPGLTQAEAARRLARAGPNAIREAAAPWWQALLAKFWAPVPWLLEAAIVLQLALGERLQAAVVGGLLILNAALAQFQEGRAGAALDALRQRLAPTALVRRDGVWKRLPAVELVPGDAIRVSLGAIVPADARIAAGAVLADVSLLTGESVPSEAVPGDLLYAGALVRRGQALAEVTATGAGTYFGRTAELVRLAHASSTEQNAILATVRALVVVAGVAGVFTLTLAHAFGLPPVELWRLALTLLLATIPLALPATFTLSAALGAQRLGRHGVLLTRLAAVHEAAAMDLLCADKTGTLTRNALEIAAVAPVPGLTRERVLALAALASAPGDQDPVDATIRRAAPRRHRPGSGCRTSCRSTRRPNVRRPSSSPRTAARWRSSRARCRRSAHSRRSPPRSARRRMRSPPTDTGCSR